jgi:hypothetical protein
MTGRWTQLGASRVVALLLFSLAAVPAIYVLIAIQYSALTVPFWDHAELIRWIVPLYDGNFHFSSLWAPHNHTRPFVYRLVMVFNAWMTDWDIRSEYIYMYFAIYGTFACHAWLIGHLLKGVQDRILLPTTLLVSSLLLFSPAGHNNHWWSMMFQLNVTNFFIALGFVLVVVWPTRWGSHIVAAVSCWLAAFTLTNGFFAMAAIIVLLQLSAPRILHPDRFVVFWTVNLVVAAGCYLPGMTMDTSPTHPGIAKMVEFTLAYLGAPLAGLLWFPFGNMFDLPSAMVPNVAAGCVLVVACLALCFHAWPRLRERNLAAMVLFGFAGFAVLSAIATGWARAALDESAMTNANASRYTIFGAYLLFGQVYYVVTGIGQGWWAGMAWGRRAVAVVTAAFVVLSFVSYSRATRVYAHARQFNEDLAQAYIWGFQPTAEDKFIHPSPETVSDLKHELQRLEIGPYSNRSYLRVQLPVGKFGKATLLSGNRKVTQRFVASQAGLKDLAFKFVTPNGPVSPGRVSWEVREAGGSSTVASGDFDYQRAHDWQEFRVKLPYLADSKGKTYELTLTGVGDDARPLGLPLYAPEATGNPPVVLSDDGDTPSRERFSMDLTTEYVR